MKTAHNSCSGVSRQRLGATALPPGWSTQYLGRDMVELAWLLFYINWLNLIFDTECNEGFSRHWWPSSCVNSKLIAHVANCTPGFCTFKFSIFCLSTRLGVLSIGAFFGTSNKAKLEIPTVFHEAVIQKCLPCGQEVETPFRVFLFLQSCVSTTPPHCDVWFALEKHSACKWILLEKKKKKKKVCTAPFQVWSQIFYCQTWA